MSRILDDRGRLFGKVNIVDLVVLLVIAAVVVFAAVRLTGGGAVETVPVRVTFVDARVDNALVAGLQTKGTVKDLGGNVIGEVQSVQVDPQRGGALDHGGRVQDVRIRDPERCDVRGAG